MALNHQQNYLLERLPKLYDLKNSKDDTEPKEVVHARKVIAIYTEKTSKQRVDREKHLKKVIAAAKEAIYFKPSEEALEVVKRVEAEWGK